MLTGVRIGNQTSAWSSAPLEPFHFALEHGFDAFEWFADKKEDPRYGTRGWDEGDMDGALRRSIRAAGQEHNLLYTVHAPWQANPLFAEGIEHLLRSVDFARDIGADLVNLHLYMDQGPVGYATSLQPVIQAARQAGVRVSIENTPHTTPEDFNQTFAELRRLDDGLDSTVGMCLDIGHANLCQATHNDFIGFMDALVDVPIIHMHVHENYGDRDSHLPLFTGPAATDDSGVRALLERLDRRSYHGALILEQWPEPPELLSAAEGRLRELMASIRGQETKMLTRSVSEG
jgi:sugar phosphate isomerase/epimerase